MFIFTESWDEQGYWVKDTLKSSLSYPQDLLISGGWWVDLGIWTCDYLEGFDLFA